MLLYLISAQSEECGHICWQNINQHKYAVQSVVEGGNSNFFSYSGDPADVAEKDEDGTREELNLNAASHFADWNFL